jgi:FAD-linked oxidoreductase
LVSLVKTAASQSRQIRVVGAGHSFTPLAQTDDILVSLDQWQGIESVDPAQHQVTVRAGSRLAYLGNELLDKGLAQENLGDIDVQSIAGAISTGTHGTGIRFGTLATQVIGLTLVTAQGEVLECSQEQHPELFKAAQTSFGTLGIIAKVTLRTVPAKRLHYHVQRERLSVVLAQLERYKQEHSHFEFYSFPYSEWTQVKFMDETDEPADKSSLLSTLNKVVLENWVYWLISETCRIVPPFCKTACHISTAGIATVDEVNYSHRLFATPRMVRFQEMEYNLPAEHFTDALMQVRESIVRQRIRVHFPIECRFVKGDDIWLSPAYQRDSAYIAVHMYKGMPYEDYFRTCEAIYQPYQGRPHWGKMHTLDHQTLAQRYPRWQDFLRIRQQLDPQGLFLNGYLRTLLGVA